MARTGRPPKKREELGARSLQDKRAQERDQATEHLTALLAPLRSTLESRLKEIGSRVEADPALVTDVAIQAEIASIGRGLSLASTLEGLELIPPANRSFTLGKLHELCEALGGDYAAITEFAFELNMTVKDDP